MSHFPHSMTQKTDTAADYQQYFSRTACCTAV